MLITHRQAFAQRLVSFLGENQAERLFTDFEPRFPSHVYCLFTTEKHQRISHWKCVSCHVKGGRDPYLHGRKWRAAWRLCWKNFQRIIRLKSYKTVGKIFLCVMSCFWSSFLNTHPWQHISEKIQISSICLKFWL